MSMGPIDPRHSFPGRPNEPFFFGRGGKRMTPEDITLRRRLGLQQLQQGIDTSPVGHWTAGLARVANSLAGRLEMNRADKAADRNADESRSVVEALLSGQPSANGGDPIAAALANPYVDDSAQSLAVKMWEQRNPRPSAPPEIIELAQIANDPARPEYERQAAADRIRAVNDPFITFSGPSFGYAGPQSEFATALGGGQANATPPATLPPDFDFSDPTVENTPAPTLGANGMPATLTRQQYQAVVAAKGQAATDAWARRNGIRVQD